MRAVLLKRQLASGFGSVVYETVDGRICRVARSRETEEAFARECRFLPWLAARLPIAIPVPIDCGQSYMLYRKLAGEPLQPAALEHLDQDKLAREIAGFLHALHSASVAEAVARGIPAHSRTRNLLCAADRAIPLLPERFQTAARNWRERFEEPAHPEVVIHGDLWHENLLIDAEAGSLSGVVDFEQTSIGDPAWDIAALLHCGPEFARMVLDAYASADGGLWLRAETLYQLRAFEGLDWAARRDDTAEFDEGVCKLQSVGVLT